jgi:uncharacterized protein YvpB
MSLTLKIETNTVLKRKPLQSSELPEEQKQAISAGRQFKIDSYTIERDHVRCFLSEETIKDTNIWYAFGKHIKIFRESQVYPRTLPATIKLKVPYKSQRDNVLNPDGACNVTSIAMCLRFLGATPKRSEIQFEDELYNHAIQKGYSRHSPYDLAKIVQDYGFRDDFRTNATIEQVRNWLADGNPVVIHGYFTDFGHIVAVAGYDERGFFVHDPYGEWFGWGYDLNEPGRNDRKGEYIHYSYTMIERLCIPDGNFWAHFISKP